MTASTTNGGAEVAVVRRFIDEVINGGQLDLVDELWSKDLEWHGGSLGEIHGLASYKAFLRAAAEGAFSGMHLTVHDVVAADGKVAVRFTNSVRGAFIRTGFSREARYFRRQNPNGLYRIAPSWTLVPEAS
jgi:limonene-1,2-epoxide hydrolase